MNSFKRLRQLISWANSKTGSRVEQSEWTRKTSRSVEVTVETDEFILLKPADLDFSDYVASANEQQTSDQDGRTQPARPRWLPK